MNKIFISLLTALSVMVSAASAMAVGFEDNAGLDSNEVALFDSDTKYGDYLYYELNSDGKSVTITKCDNSAAGEMVIPNEIEGLPVTSIGDGAFSYCIRLTSVTIPDSVTVIGDRAFVCCSGLTSIAIPDSVTAIGYRAFYDTAYYNDENNWENDVLYIGNHLIAAKTDIAGLCTIKNNTICIADRAFVSCASLTGVTIPDGVTSIGSSAFYGCSSLTNVTIPDSVTNIGEQTFYGCSSLISVTIPDGVAGIGAYTFYSCDSLISVTIPDSVTNIGEQAFYGCSYLTDITIPDSVTDIGIWAFSYCVNLTSVTLPDSITSISDGMFYECSSLTNVTIPNSVTDIGNQTFYECSSLTSVVIPVSVTDIGYQTFYGCGSLTSITIPDSVTGIGESAFAICDALTDVYYPGSEDQWNSISIAAYNDPLITAAIHFNAITNPTEPETAAVTVSAPVIGEDGTSVVEVTVPALGNVYANGIVYGVSYDDSGITDISSTPLVNGGNTSLEVGADGAQTVRVFVWNDKMQPITTAFEAQLQPEI